MLWWICGVTIGQIESGLNVEEVVWELYLKLKYENLNIFN